MNHDIMDSTEAVLSNASQAVVENDIFADINWPEDQEPEGDLLNSHDNVKELDKLSNVGFCACENECSCKGVSDLATITDFVGKKDNNILSTDHLHNGVLQAPETEYSPESNGSKTASDSQPSFRFSKEVKSILRVWFNEHKDNPYPTSEEKDELAEKTQLKKSQVSLWLANTRRRYRSRNQDTAQQNRRDPRVIPPPDQPKEDLNPFERWKVLPLEEEATAAPLILSYIESTSSPAANTIQDSAPIHYAASTFDAEQSTTTYNDYFWAQSMASYETGPTSMVNGSSISDTTAFSHSLAPSLHSQSTRGPQSGHRRRRTHKKPPPKPTSGRKDRPFQCTFCPNTTFATKYDWQRHEKSQHLSLEKWVCCVTGGTVDTKDGPACAFCGCLFPDTLHLEKHNYLACHERDLTQRTFYRKDHFQQHLRLTHQSKYHPSMEAWKDEMTQIKSRCGFCNARFNTWAARADHLALHFKCHADLKDWTEGLGLEPHIAALVERSTRVATSDLPLKAYFALPELPRSCLDKSYPGFAASQDSFHMPYDAGGRGMGQNAYHGPGISATPSDSGNYSSSDFLDWALQ